MAADDAIVRPGLPVSDTVRLLRELAIEVGNVVAGGGLAIEVVRDQYLTWVEKAELQLRSRFTSDVWRALHSRRYWHIRTIGASSARPFPVIQHEAHLQAERLDHLATSLERDQQHFSLASDCTAAILDTNVLLHFRRFDEVDWPSIIGFRTVRLVVPLIIVDELDDLSYRSSGVSDRARSLLKAMRRYRTDRAPHEPSEVRRGVTMQMLVDPPGHHRVPNNDSELLSRVEHVTSLTGSEATLLSGDYGMQLRAEVRGIRCIDMPDNLRLAQPERA